MTNRRISDSTVRRLSLYLRLLRELAASGGEVTSSRELAARSHTTAAQVRKDLSAFGSFGKRGRGYDVVELERVLESILGLGRRWRVALFGVGKIGGALLGYRDLARRGFDIVAAFDADETKIGRELFGVRVDAPSDLGRVVRECQVEIAILATPPEAACASVALLAEAGVTGILSFAPVELEGPPGVWVRTMDVALELEGLSFLLSNREAKRIPANMRAAHAG